ncbi:flavin-containing monooxygenase [Nocardioides insulae]|uniref:flavin-containing monooxygenase n=1 Tax=Nocardioides insulae TaxID=394734 RepID=UPI0004188722|nr:NAD(P)/FAD-dependent oxidoreductase [Nocardioides insulae]
MAQHYDALVIGAGFSGMYQLIRLREQGFSTRVVEKGTGVGGTWYWNRYPGARVDIESVEYSYSFDDALQQEWDWSERYAAQPEILRYAEHVADRYDLRRDISFETSVEKAVWDEESDRWTVTMLSAEGSETVTASYVIAATGCLSMPSRPHFEGMDDFEGETYWTSSYPREGVDLTDKRVAVIGTGSSGLQTITAIAPVVGELTVFQRTPSYAVPAHNGPEADRLREVRPQYPAFRELSALSPLGFQCGEDNPRVMMETDPVDVRAELDRRWAVGGLCFNSGFEDTLRDQAANDLAAEYVRDQIRAKVKDPEVAEKLCPTTYPIASKRMCVDTGYFEVYNQDNVSLVDLQETPIERFSAKGVVAGGTEYEVDVIILATGFDAMTGALNAIEFRNGEQVLSEKWEHGPRTYLGLMSVGFPNLLTVTGPQSPSVLSNMMTSIEYHVDWITRLLQAQRAEGLTRIEPRPEAEDNWVNTTNDLADLTLMPQASSWYMGANIPGKQRVFMPFIGGVGAYKQIGDGIATVGYHGFDRA